MGSSGGNSQQASSLDFMNLMTMKAAKDLSLDMMIPGQPVYGPPLPPRRTTGQGN